MMAIMGKAAKLTVVQMMTIGTFHEQGKPKEGHCCLQNALSKHIEVKLTGRKKIYQGKSAEATVMTTALREVSPKLYSRTSEGVTEASLEHQETAIKYIFENSSFMLS